MKFLLIFLASVMLTTAAPRNNYKISGEVKGIPDSTEIGLFMRYPDMATSIAFEYIIDGKFCFNDTIGENVVNMTLDVFDVPDISGSCKLWVGRTDIKVIGDGKNLDTWKVESNVPEQIDADKIAKYTQIFESQIDSLYRVESKLMDSEVNKQAEIDIITKQIDSIEFLQNQTELNYFENNYNSKIAVEHLCSIAQYGDSISKARVKTIFPKIDKKYLNSLYGEGLTNYVNDHKAPEVGDYYIDLTAKDTAGIEHKISDYKNEFILLDFWSSGCSACDASLADLNLLNKKYNDKLTIISFSQVIHEPFWKDVSKNENISWVNLSDGKGRFGGSGYLYGIKGIPTFILLDSNGKIVERWSGYGEGIFEKKLSKYLDK